MKPDRLFCGCTIEVQLENERKTSERLREEIRQLRRELEESKTKEEALTRYIIDSKNKEMPWEL